MRGATLRAAGGTVIALVFCGGSQVTTGATAIVRASTSFSIAGEHDYTVPAGVTSVIVTAIGATGQTVNGVGGGDGAMVTATVAVTGGGKLYLYVNVGGGDRGLAGAFEAGDPGGHGGGESDVRTCPETAAGCGALGSADDPRLLVAAGGGGAAGYAGSDGGAAGTSATPCAPGKAGAADGPSGLGASCTAPGGRGPVSDLPYVGADGGPGEGGSGGAGYKTEAEGAASIFRCGFAYNGGGGGGAGYFGGGGGDAGCGDLGGGGGGGSSYVAISSGTSPGGHNPLVSRATIRAARRQPASVSVSHDELTKPPPSSSGNFPLWVIPVALAVLAGVAALVVRRQQRPPAA
ncbi:MAG TPA: glycine-rich protein [Solirubrobacteraceae bacterium]|nr:glycine-rich protein [Solirubrobacteraceae bacterium]